MMTWKVPLSLLAAAALSACTQFHLVPAGTVDIYGQMEVDTAIAWNGQQDADVVLWTQDGPALDQMIFHVGVKDGDTLFEKVNFANQEPWLIRLMGKERDLITLRFRKTMTELELMDLFVATYTLVNDNRPITAENLAPVDFGGQPGFRFDYRRTGPDEVIRQGLAMGAVVDGRLYLAHYQGSALHHFDKNREQVERILASARFRKKKEG